jgi:MFS transporter, DHA1 family, inner membrane transport protein
MSHTALEHRPVLSTPAVLRLAIAYAVAINGLVLTPFIVSAVTKRFGVDDGVATQVAGIEILGIAVSCAVFPRWIARTVHTFSRLGLIGAILAQVASAFANTPQLLGAARGVGGLFEGMLFVVVAASVAHRDSTDRLWGQIIFAAGVLDGGILVGVSFLPDTVLAKWLFLLLAGVMLLSAPVLVHVGQYAGRPPSRSAAEHAKKAPVRLILAVWMVTFLLYGIQASQWAIAGIVGTRIGLSDSTLGILLSLSSLLGFVGAAVPSQPASHRYRLPIIWLAQLAMVASLTIFFESTGAVWYFASQTLLNASLFVVIPFLTGMLSEVDVDGSLVSRTVVITFIGAGVGTVMAGGEFSDLGGVRFGYAMSAGILLAAPFVWYALRAAATHELTATDVSRLASARHGRASATVPR